MSGFTQEERAACEDMQTGLALVYRLRESGAIEAHVAEIRRGVIHNFSSRVGLDTAGCKELYARWLAAQVEVRRAG
jgi:hypothetical protein